MNTLSPKKGFTLIELLLYVGIASAILLFISFFIITLLQSRIKNQTVAEVEGQGLQVMQIIAQTARNAEDISSPAAGASASSLTLDVVPSGSDPTVFDAAGGAIRITEGVGNPVALTNDRVTASGVSFTNFSRVDTPGTIRIEFTLSHVNPENRNEYDYEKTFIGTGTLRQP